MRMIIRCTQFALAAGLALGAQLAAAKLPAQTPEQQQAAAIKKAQAAEQAAIEKQQLSDSMDKIAERWRARAAQEGWKTNAATPVAAPAAPPAQGTQTGQPVPAQPAMLGTPPSAQQGVPTQQGIPIRSEKFGTAPPSADVKTNQPSGTRLQERIYKNPVEEPPHKMPSK